jgi:hypothetical protein
VKDRIAGKVRGVDDEVAVVEILQIAVYFSYLFL